MTVGERIKSRREELCLTQEELAKRVGYKSRSSINKIELSRDLPLRKVEKMAKALDTTPSMLMGWNDPGEITKNIKDAFALLPNTPNIFSQTFPNLSDSEWELIQIIRDFNQEGKEKVYAYARDLKSTGVYIKTHSDSVVEGS